MSFKVAVIQFDIHLKDPERNRKKVEELVSKAIGHHLDVLLLSETWSTGFSRDVLEEAAGFAKDEAGTAM